MMTDTDQQQNLSLLEVQIATLKAAGNTLSQISKEVGLSRSAISRRSNKADVRAFIQSLSERLAKQTAETIVENHVLAVQAANRTWREIAKKGSTEDAARLASQTKDLLEMADKKEKRAGQAMGLFPTPGTNVLLQNIFHGPTQVVVSQAVAELIGNATRGDFPGAPDDDEPDLIDLIAQADIE